MIKRTLVIIIILMLTINLISLDKPESKHDYSIEIAPGPEQDPADGPAEEGAGLDSDEKENVKEEPPLRDGGNIEQVVLTKPGGAPDSPESSTGSRGLWNYSGQPMLEDGFEGAFPGQNWYVFDNLSNASNNYSDFWGKSTNISKNGTYSVFCAATNASTDPGPPGNYTGNHSGYDDNMYSWMISGPYNLSDGRMLNARLSFWYWLQTEEASDGKNDSFFWAASKDNKTFTGFRENGNYSYWRFKEYYLNDYDGKGGSLIGEKEVWVAFVFRSNGTNIGNPYNYTGVYIDDVRFENYTNRAPTKPTSLNVSGPNIRRVIQDKPFFNWTFNDPDNSSAEGPSGYHIQIGTDDNWTVIEKWNSNISAYYSTFIQYGSSNPLEDGKTYWIRVKTRDMDGAWSPWSDSFNFSMNDPPSPPLVQLPSKDMLWEGGSQHNITWINSTNDDNGTDDIITINVSLSTNGGLNYTDLFSGITNNGTYLWTLPSNIESGDCKLKLTAFDGYETDYAISSRFKIDSLGPVINDIKVSSNKSWYYVPPGMNGTGGEIWFNSIDGEGANQVITLDVDWSDVSPTSLEGALAFGDLPKDNDSSPTSIDYSIEALSGDATGVKIKVVDFFGRFSEATIDFYEDNVDPTAPTNVVCHPDSFSDTGEVDDDNQIFVTYVKGADAGVGIRYARLGTDNPPTQTINSADGEGLVTSYLNNLNVSIFVAMVDNVGNVGPSANDTIIIDQLAPNTPVIYSKTHPNSSKYYSNPNPEFNWTWPDDLSGVVEFSIQLNTKSSYIPQPDPPVSDPRLTVNYTSFTGIPDGANFFHVRTLDKAGHWSLGSSSFKIFIDTTPPLIQDHSDKKGLTNETMTFKAQALDNGSGINNKAQLYYKYASEIDFINVEMALIDDRFEANFITDPNKEGYIEYYFTVEDLAINPNIGRYPTSGYARVMITDNIKPGIIWGTNDTFGTTGDPVNITVMASDNIKPDRILLFVETWSGHFEMEESLTVPNNFSTHIILPSNSLEPLRYYVEIYDAQNNMIRVPSFGFFNIIIFDNDAPDISFVTGDVSKTNENSVTVIVQPEDNVEPPLVLTAKLYSSRNDALFSMVPVEAIDGFQYVFELFSEIKLDIDYYILVQDTSGNTIRSPVAEDEFYHLFVPNIVAPNGGEIWNKTQAITWMTPNIPGKTFTANLSYSKDMGQTWTSIVEGLRNVNTYDWDTTGLLDESSYLIKLDLLFSNGIFCTDRSDNEFIIYNPDKPTINIEFPRAGDSVFGSYEVKWSVNDPDPTDKPEVDIQYMELSNNSKGEWKTLAENQPATGSFNWNTLNFNDGQYKLNFIVNDDVFEDQSFESGEFSIYNPDPPLVVVTDPKTNDIWDSKHKVKWVATDADDEELLITIILRRVTDGNQSVLFSDIPNTGEIDVDLSQYPEGIYVIIVEADDGSVLDPQAGESGVFDIVHGAGISISTVIIIMVLIAVLVICLMVLFMKARTRRYKYEKEKRKEEAKLKVQKPKHLEELTTDATAIPGAPLVAQQLPGAAIQQVGTTEEGVVVGVPQLPAGEVETSKQVDETPAVEGLAGGPQAQDQIGLDTGGQVQEGVQEPGIITAEIYEGDPTKITEQTPETEQALPQEHAVGGGVSDVKQKGPKKKFCGECGAPVGDDDVVCVSCGKFQK